MAILDCILNILNITFCISGCYLNLSFGLPVFRFRMYIFLSFVDRSSNGNLDCKAFAVLSWPDSFVRPERPVWNMGGVLYQGSVLKGFAILIFGGFYEWINILKYYDCLKAVSRYIRKRVNMQINILKFYDIFIDHAQCRSPISFATVHSISCLFILLLIYPPGCLF